jgi:hypothetical protein
LIISWSPQPLTPCTRFACFWSHSGFWIGTLSKSRSLLLIYIARCYYSWTDFALFPLAEICRLSQHLKSSLRARNSSSAVPRSN